VASKARAAFDKNCEDIDRLLEVHTSLTGTGPGRRRQVEVLHKAAIVLVTAFWEAYCEDVAAEALSHLVQHSPDASKLPTELKKQIVKELGDDANQLAVWQLADTGWKQVLNSRLVRLREERNRRLNTPKTAQIDELFVKALGVNKISSRWYWSGMSVQTASDKLDRYVALRGSIAHRGTAVGSVHKKHVIDYYEHVKKLVGKTGGRVNTVVRTATGKQLW
jgi:hypothetical protein